MQSEQLQCEEADARVMLSSTQKVIGHQRPCVTGRILLLQKTGQSFKKIFPVLIIFENPSPLDSSDDNMMQGARGIYAGLTGHAFQISAPCLLVNKETTSPYTGRGVETTTVILRAKHGPC